MKQYTKYGYMNDKDYENYKQACRDKAIKQLNLDISMYQKSIEECKREIERYEKKEIY